MIDQDMMRQVKAHAEKRIGQVISQEYWDEMQNRNFEHAYVVEVFTTKLNFGKVGANKIADDIHAMLKACATNTGAQTTPTQTAEPKNSNVLKWVLGGLMGVVLIGLIVAFFFLNGKVDRFEDQSEHISALETEISTFDTKKADRIYVDEKLVDVTKSIDDLAKSTGGLLEKVEKLTNDLGGKLDRSEFTAKTKEIDGELEKKADAKELSKKADRVELDKTRQDLRDVEDKLDAHLADMKADLADKTDEGLVDPYADDDDVDLPVAPADDGTINLKVPKGSEVKTFYSK